MPKFQLPAMDRPSRRIEGNGVLLVRMQYRPGTGRCCRSRQRADVRVTRLRVPVPPSPPARRRRSIVDTAPTRREALHVRRVVADQFGLRLS